MTHNPHIQPARRVDDIKEYYFSIKLKEVAALNAAGADIISLGIGGPDRQPAPDVISTMQQAVADPSNHSYQTHIGLPELRDKFAQWYKNTYNVDLNPANEILPLIGSKEGVLHISLTFLNPGDGVLVPNPGYPTYSSVSKMVGAKIVPYDLSEQNGWLPDFEALERMPLDGIKLMWINYPHMPTGTPATMQLFEKIVQFGRRHNIVIAHDNPYSFILNDHPLSLLSVDGAKEIALEMNSLSKSHNMAGWRVGMVASNPTFISWLLKVKSNIDSGQFKPTMLAAAQALSLPQEWYDSVNDTYRSRRQSAEAIMTELGCTFDPRQQGLFLWGRIPDSEQSSEALADRLLHDARVFLTPGFIFGSNGERYIRISLCTPVERMNQALQRIKKMNQQNKS